MANPQERRRFFRLDSRLCVRYRLANSDRPEHVTHTENISASGLRLASGESIPTQSRLELVLDLPDGGPSIPAVGEVMWQRPGTSAETPGSVGIFLLETDPGFKERFLDFSYHHIGQILESAQRNAQRNNNHSSESR